MRAVTEQVTNPLAGATKLVLAACVRDESPRSAVALPRFSNTWEHQKIAAEYEQFSFVPTPRRTGGQPERHNPPNGVYIDEEREV
jgi:hypothetical protein